MTKPYQRRKIFIDRPVQLAVLGRATLYWSMCTMTQVLMVLFFGIITSSHSEFPALSPEVRWHLQITLLASVVLLPILLLDILKLSHRWVGPIFRLRNSLRALGRGENLSEVKFRDMDYWQDLAIDLNAVSAELERLRTLQSGDITLDEDDEPVVSAAAKSGNKNSSAPAEVGV